MTKFARFDNNVVLETFVGEDVNKAFHPSIATQFEPVPDDVEPGYTRNGNSFTPPAAPEPGEQPETPTTPPNYTGYNEIEFVQYVQTISGMSDEKLLQFYEDTSVPIRSLRLKLEKLGDYRLTPLNPVVSDGLDKLIDADYITEAHKVAILTNWPTNG